MTKVTTNNDITRKEVLQVDNRDSDTTWLWISPTEYIEVNIKDLVQNARENSPTERAFEGTLMEWEWAKIVALAGGRIAAIKFGPLEYAAGNELKDLEEEIAVLETIRDNATEILKGEPVVEF